MAVPTSVPHPPTLLSPSLTSLSTPSSVPSASMAIIPSSSPTLFRHRVALSARRSRFAQKWSFYDSAFLAISRFAPFRAISPLPPRRRRVRRSPFQRRTPNRSPCRCHLPYLPQVFPDTPIIGGFHDCEKKRYHEMTTFEQISNFSAMLSAGVFDPVVVMFSVGLRLG